MVAKNNQQGPREVKCITKDGYFMCERFATLYRSGQHEKMKANLYGNKYLGKDSTGKLSIIKVENMTASVVGKTCWLTDDQFNTQFAFEDEGQTEYELQLKEDIDSELTERMSRLH